MISFVWQVIGIIVIVLGVVALFYWLRYGGTFKHRNKPEWDFIPSIVKNDAFLAKAVIDDLIALELVYKHDVNEVLQPNGFVQPVLGQDRRLFARGQFSFILQRCSGH